MKIISTDKAPAAVGPYSQAIVDGGIVYASGQIPVDPATGEMKTSVSEAARQSLTNLKNLLESSGSDLENVLKVNIFITDMGKFGELNEVYAEFFAHHRPARSCVEVTALPKDAVLEIEAIARVN
ncbi:putative endoribonuclease L-PSP [Aedoeadaptatus coxii]|uniref:Putative endoribonuclease L-PSP n=1 Tax=Aedoeadaptatus coxii TaxID=755172 RepID=A0A134ABY8_9FIRM|nr:RidA family protein [Peptoniphilus coxii]KXB65231.1 putative endoribonuclease L-PSP [Peptoniphilus coxii]CAC9929597.1 putative endoribonuclease L-PSP [Peptoniphilus coxii]